MTGISKPGGVSGAGVLGPYADSTALQASKPAASYPGSTAYVGASAPYTLYFSNGSAWAISADSTTRFDTPNKSIYAFGSGNASATGVEATTMGYRSGNALTFQYSCTSYGAWSMESNIDGSDITAIGCEAFQKAIGGVGGTAVGKRAARWALTANGTTALGDTALEFNQNGIRNTAGGYSSLRDLDGGDDNAAWGNYSGIRLLGTASLNTMLGTGAGSTSEQKTDANNSTAIGSNSRTTADNQTVIGNGSSVEVVLRGSRLKVGELGSGTNGAGGNYTINASAGTGSGEGGEIIFATAPAGSSGSSLNPLVGCFRFRQTGHFQTVTHNTHDIGGDGVFAPRYIYAATAVIGGNILCGASGVLGIRSSTQLSAAVNGNLRIMNSANTSFGLLQFGTTTSASPAIKRNGAAVQIRLADDSAFAPLTASVVQRAPFTFATLPAAGSWEGGDSYITDSNTATLGAAAAGGGSNKVLVWSDGATWKVSAS